MSQDYTKIEAWQCEHCGSLHEHPSLAERCAMKCRWEDLIEQIAVEQENNKKLAKAERLETLEGMLEGLKE